MPKASKLLKAVIVVTLIWAILLVVDWNYVVEITEGKVWVQNAEDLVLAIKYSLVVDLAFIAGRIGRE